MVTNEKTSILNEKYYEKKKKKKQPTRKPDKYEITVFLHKKK